MAKPKRVQIKFNRDFPGFLGILRKQIFESQAKAAMHIGISQSTITRYERGDTRPDPGYIAYLTKLCVEHLYENEEDKGHARSTYLKEINRAMLAEYLDGPKKGYQFLDWEHLEVEAETYYETRAKGKAGEKSFVPPSLGNETAEDKILSIKLVEPVSFKIQDKPSVGSAPPVPSLVVGRENDIQNLKDNLGITATTQPRHAIQIMTAVRGWPGVGKTTLASILAHDPEISQAFPDGILWASLGPTPNLLSELATWGRTLGTDELLRARTLEEASAQLRGLLRNKRIFLIIDDVWEAEHGVPFNVGGRDCATLITTRHKNVADALAPTPDNVYLLPVLTDDKSLELLSALASDVISQYSIEALELVHELEGLPLALQVAGRLLHTEAGYGFGVKELIVELREGAKLLMTEAPADRADVINETTPTIAALLEKSVERLDQFTQDCYAYLGVFASKPATFDLEAMKSVWQVDDPKPTARTLVGRGLLEYVPEMDRYQMHAVLVMHAKSYLT